MANWNTRLTLDHVPRQMPNTVDCVEGERERNDGLAGVFEPLRSGVNQVNDTGGVERQASDGSRDIGDQEPVEAYGKEVPSRLVRSWPMGSVE